MSGGAACSDACDARHLVEMGISIEQDEVMLQDECCDPEIVRRDWTSLLSQRQIDMAIPTFAPTSNVRGRRRLGLEAGRELEKPDQDVVLALRELESGLGLEA